MQFQSLRATHLDLGHILGLCKHQDSPYNFWMHIGRLQYAVTHFGWTSVVSVLV